MNPIIIIRFPIVLQTLIMPDNLWIPKCFPYIVKPFIQALYHVRAVNIFRFNLCLFSFVVCEIKLLCGCIASGDTSKSPYIYQKQINAKASYKTTAALFTQSTCCHSTTWEHRHVVYKTASEPHKNENIIEPRLLQNTN